MTDVIVRDVRIVPLDTDADQTGPGTSRDPGRRDILVIDGQIAAIGVALERPEGTVEMSGEGRWALPGLWDHHVHMTQWGLGQSRLDTGAVTGVEETQALVRARLTSGPLPPSGVVTGWGHRSATWAVQPTVAALDEVSAHVPIVLVSGDGHHGWLNSSALALVGAAPTAGVIAEGPWFAIYDRLSALPGVHEEGEAGVAAAIRAAHTLGIVGLTDLEFGRPWEQWRHRKAEGMPLVRARVGVYAEGLEEVIAAGVRTGDLVTGTRGLVTMGPLKVISDGSLNTRTAWCCEPYADGDRLEDPYGAANLSAHELHELMDRAHRGGLHVAIHAIGDAAVHQALTVFASTGAVGGIEHAQLVAPTDLELWGRLPVRASVQPAHLLDDRAVTEQCWPDRSGHTFTLRSFLDHGIEVVLGSDAPVSPLDPWLAMAAAVHRGPLDGQSWHPEQALSVREALAASVDGQRLSVGGRGDLILLDEDPLGAADGTSGDQARLLRGIHVSATVLDGQVVHGG